MKQSKFSLADVLTILTALVFGFICFLGKNFSNLGNTSESITWAAIITVSLAGTAYIAKLLKRTSCNFRTNFILEITVLLLFTGLTVFFAYSLFPHYFNVSAKQMQIRQKLKTSITQAENMFPKYEQYAEARENAFKGKLDAVIALKNPSELKYYDFRDDVPPYNTQITHKMYTLHTDLFPTNYSDTTTNDGIKEVATAWLKSAKGTTNSWKPIGIVSVVNDVENKSKYWLNELIGFSKSRENGEPLTDDLDFSYQLTFNDIKTHFTTLGKPTPLSIGLAAGAYLLMLFSYFISKRSSKTTVGTTKEKGEYDIDF